MAIATRRSVAGGLLNALENLQDSSHLCFSNGDAKFRRETDRK